MDKSDKPIATLSLTETREKARYLKSLQANTGPVRRVEVEVVNPKTKLTNCFWGQVSKVTGKLRPVLFNTRNKALEAATTNSRIVKAVVSIIPGR